MKLQILSINILNSRYKFIFILIINIFIYYTFYKEFIFIENMGNCCSIVCEEPPIQSSDNLPTHLLTMEALQTERRMLQNRVNNLQQNIAELLAHDQNLEKEKLELQEAYNLCKNNLQQKENEMDDFIDEIARSAFVDDFAHIETYKKLKSCLEEKRALQHELNTKT